MELPELDPQAVARIAPLVRIGGKSGDTVCGLSAVRRARELAYVFVDAGVAEGTVRQLRRQGAQVWVARAWEELAGSLGRAEVLVLGIKAGPLAEGIARRLAESGRRE